MVDVARHAGVSVKTVSRVVNREPAVSPATVTRVQRAITALGFRRHDGASSLRRGHTTASLGLVLEDVSNPFYSVITRAVEEVARAHRYLVFTGSSDEDAEREREVTLAFCDRRVDGLLVVPAGDDHRYLRDEMVAGTHVVFLDRPGVQLSADAVLADNRGGVRTAVEHLVVHGHRRIAFLGDQPTVWTARERRAGFEQAMSGIGLAVGAGWVTMGPHTEQSVRAVCERLRRGRWPLTALITGNNRITMLALRALAAMDDWRPALVGFDDFERAGQLQPGVTVIEQNPDALGKRAAELLFARIDGERGPPHRVVLPTRLIPRGSGELRP